MQHAHLEPHTVVDDKRDEANRRVEDLRHKAAEAGGAAKDLE